METMAKRVKIPVTVKCRLGVDDFKDYEFVQNFVRIVSNDQKGSVKHFIIHSRIALLKGLNPA
jgi:tRNA-dihydrouridine synthase A